MANWWDDLEPQAAASGKNWWDDLVPEQRKPFGYREETPESANWDGPVMVPASTRRSFGEFMSDLKPAIGAGVGSAAAGLAQLPADTWNAAVQYSPLRMAIEKASPQTGARIQNALSVEQPGVVRAATDLLQGAVENQREQYSSGHQAFQEQLEHTEGFMPTAGLLLTSPGHLATMGTEVGAQMAPGGVGARGLGMLSRGLRGARAQTGANVALQSGMAGSLAQDEVQAVLEATPVSELRQHEDFNQLKYMLGTDDDEAVKDWLIRNNSTSAFAQSFGVNLATSLMIPGGATVESAMLGNAGRAGTSRLRNAALGAAGEATSEGLAEAGEAVSQNVATYQPWDEGVGQAGALGSILGAGMGGVAGGLQQRARPLREGDDLLGDGNITDALKPDQPEPEGNLTDTLQAQQLAQLEADVDAAMTPEETEAAEARLREFRQAIQQSGPGDVDAMLSGLFDGEADPADTAPGAEPVAARDPIPMPRGPATQEQMFANIHLDARDAELSRQRDAELDLIARESRLPVALRDAENETAIAEASGALDVAEAPTAMQLAMQEAMRRRQQAQGAEPATVAAPVPEAAPATEDSAPEFPKREFRNRLGANGQVLRDSKGRPLKEPVLDYSTDTLVHWLAANGGVNFEQVRAQGGADPALMRYNSVQRPFGVIGMPALRRNGGMSLDDVRERMQQSGWLPPDDPNSPATVSDNDALDLIMDAINGQEVYHPYEGADARLMREAAERDAQPSYFGDALLDEDLASNSAAAWEEDFAPFAETLGREPAEEDVGPAYTVAELTEMALDLGADPFDVHQPSNRPQHEHASMLWDIIKERSDGIDWGRVSETDRRSDPAPAGRAAATVQPAQDRSGEDGGALGQGEGGDGGAPIARTATTESAATPEPVHPVSGQGGLFAPPTTQEAMAAEVARRDAARNGQDGTGRTDMMAGDGELFAGPRPEQADIEQQAATYDAMPLETLRAMGRVRGIKNAGSMQRDRLSSELSALDRADEISRANQEGAVAPWRESVADLKGKQPWEMTRDEWARARSLVAQAVAAEEGTNMAGVRSAQAAFRDFFGYSDAPNGNARHDLAVFDALEAGHPVPESVRAEYRGNNRYMNDSAEKSRRFQELLGSGPQQQGDPQEIEHNGTRIYQTLIRSGEDVVTRFAVESADNKARREAGERAIGGDSLHDTLEAAKAAADQERKQKEQKEARDAALKAESDAKAQAEATRKADDLNGFTASMSAMQAGKVKAALDKLVRFDGVVMSLRKRVESLHADGSLAVETFEEPAIKPMSRTRFNRATQREQAAHEAKMKAAGNKTVYLVNGSDIGKTAYDYAQFLLAKPAHSADSAKGKKKAESAPREADEPVSAENARERITPDTAAEMRSGDIVVDDQGNEYRAHTARHDWLEAHPIINGRADVSADSRVVFLLTPSKADVYPERRNVPIYATGRNISDQPDAPNKGKPSATGTAADTKLDDFGEKLEGARKHLPPSLAEELGDEQIASQPLSKIWPANAHESIEDDTAAALAFAARAVIPAKPRTSYKVRAWVEKVKAAREIVRDPELARELAERGEQLARGSRELSALLSRARLLSQLSRDTWGRVESVGEYPDAYRHEKGKQVASPFSSVSIDGKRHTFDVGRIGPDEVQKVKELLGTEAPKKGGLTRSDFQIRGPRRGGSAFINRKGDPELRPLKTFTGEDAVKLAREFLSANVAELEAEWEAVKKRDNVAKADTRRDQNRERVGENRRDGKDVTEQMFTDAFGFRGVQFGNWVKQGKGAKDRQGLLNDAYDALLDLADILGIPSRAISLNGTMGLSLGARGSGRAAAHFERDNLVINLTKTKGAGSLAHEWFHSLDNYFSRLRGSTAASPREGDYITYKPEPAYVHRNGRSVGMSAAQLRVFLKRTKQWDEGKTLEENAAAVAGGGYVRDPNHQAGVRPQVERAFAELVEALNASPMAQRSRSLDKGKSGYWSRIIERGARSFENYVISKMAQRGWSNDFLANIRNWKEWAELGKNSERYPYLLPEEEAPVVEAFDNLFATIESRTDPETGNVPLFSRSRTARRGTPLGEEKNRAIEAIAVRVAGVNSVGRRLVNVVDGAAGLPAEVRQHMADEGIPAEEVRGVHWKGRTWLVAENLHSVQDVEETLFHEHYTHFGLRAKYGAKLGGELGRLLDGIGGIDGVRKIAADQGIELSHYEATLRASRSIPNAHKRLILMEELLAHMGEATGTLRRTLEEWLGIVRNWLRSRGFADLADYNAADLAFVLRQARQAAQEKVDAGTTNRPFYQRVFHGTPHRGIEQTGFQLNKIGTGEGAQAYGWGMYFAGQREVAEGYRQRLAGSTGPNWQRAYDAALAVDGMTSAHARSVADHIQQWVDGGRKAGTFMRHHELIPRYVPAYQAAVDAFGEVDTGQTYQVEIPEDSDLLDWDKPLSEQPEKVQRALAPLLSVTRDDVRAAMQGEGQFGWLGATTLAAIERGDVRTGSELYEYLSSGEARPREASEFLNSLGIPGLRYKDGSSRDSDGGSHNYVIWDEALLTPEAAEITPYYSRRSGDAPENEVAYRHGEEELASRLVRSGLAQEGEADGRRGVGLVPSQWAEPSAYSDVRRGEGAFVLEFASREEARAEAERLIATARREGFFWDDGAQARVAELAWNDSSGAEHDVHFVGSGNDRLAIRSTANGIYGNRADITPAMYLQRLQEYNQIFPHLQMRLIGVSEDPDGNAVLWTAQKFVEGREFDSDAELAAAMSEQGWDQDGDDPRFIHRETGAIIEDAHSGNILHADGELFPIDVHVEKLPARGTTAAVPATVESEPSAPYSPGAMFSRRAASTAAAPPAARSSTASLGTQLVNKLHADILPRMGRPGDFISEQLDDGFERDWVDEFVDLRRAEEATARRLGVNPEDLPDHMQARRQETLRHGAYQDRLRTAERDYFEPVAKILGDADLDRDGFADYLWWRHAGERDAYLRAKHAGTPGAADLAGIDPKEAAQNIANLPAKTRRAYEKAAAHIDQLRQHTLDVLVDSGQIPESTRDALLARWQHYVPLRGLPAGMDDPIIASFNGGGKGLSVARNPLGKKALGRKSKPQDILEQMHLDLERALIGAEKQKVLKSIIGLIHANPDIGKVDPVKTEKREVNGVIQHVMTSGDHTTQLTYLHHGRPVKIELANQHLTQAALNMNEPLPKALRNLAKVTRWLSAVKTAYSPYFMLINPTRDAEFAALGVAVERGRDVFKSAAKFYPHTFGALRRDRHGTPLNKDIDRYAREFAKVGGKTGYTFVNDITELRNGLNRMFAKERKGLTPGKAWRAVNDMVEAANEYAENSARLAVFAALREHGVTAEQAGKYAKEVTVNFNTKGRLGKKANAFYMFFNAAVQGTRRVHGLAKNRAFRYAMIGLTGTSYALALAQMIAMGDDDDDESLYLKKIKDTDRLRSLPISVGDEEWLSVPVPYGPNFFNYLGSKMAEITYEQMRGRKVDPAKIAGQVFNAASQSFSPIDAGDGLDALVPEIARIIQNVRHNKDDWGRPLNYTQHYNTDENRPMFAEGSVTTGDAFKVFARMINRITGGSDYEAGKVNLSPEQVRYVTQQALGGMYRLGSESYELLEKMLTDDKITAQDVPLTNVFLRSRPFERQQSEGFYENRTLVNDLRRQLKAAHERQDQSKIDSLLSEHPWLRGAQLDANSRAGKIAQARTPVGALRRTEREIRKLRVTREAAYMRVGRFEGLSAAESRAKMREIDQQIAELQKQFNATVNRAQ